ncbi:hypothetical protein ACFX19_003579 [Malus domestica]
MLATEYHRKFTDLSHCCPKIPTNPREMLHLFKRGTRKKLRFMATTTPCTTYQEFFEVLLRVEDSENAPDDEDENDDRNAQQNKNRGQSSMGPRMTQNFKRSGNISGSFSGGSNLGTPRRGSRSTGNSHFQSQ